MKNKVKYICKNCGYAEIITRPFWKGFLRFSIRGFIIVFLTVTAIFGTAGIYNFISGGIFENPDVMINIGGFYAIGETIRASFQSKSELKQVAQGLTYLCEDDYCRAKTIFEHLKTFRYDDVNGTDIDPQKIWDDKSCDCDECSFLYIIMLKKLGIKSMMQCNLNHCWTIVKLKDKKILVDIVMGKWEEY